MPGLGATLAGAGLAALPGLREWRRIPVDARLRAQAPGRFAELPGGLTHYDWLGPERGPVAVCVHGLTTPSFVWLALARRLVAMGYRLLIYDLYGRGYSGRPRGPQGPRFFTDQLRALLAHEGLDADITLIGYSMGGAIATAFAAEEAHRLRRLVLLAPAGMTHDPGRLTAWAVEWPLAGDWLFHMGFPAATRRAVAREAGAETDGIGTRQLAELNRRGFVRSVLAALRGTLRHPMEAQHRAVAQTGLPVAAIWGREDRVIPLRAMGMLTQWNRHARHRVIDGAGHGLPYTHAAEIAAALRDLQAG
ncbi:hypothetical protein AVJ23_13895 [Pseudoponticoccus marisrubri]|uniref:AB hydrolase-1 domain-containing protein n=1 Tax=Pseudoponticoccus marisrubri TaxID=1685382 RepID=A0A0W7WI59_9RHOB|nr:hypothetical protein AVJ23_13895 [Pseudoponticoccus marisrubri]